MTATPKRGERDQAIDILRGLALLTITVNHITGIAFAAGLEGMPFPTLSHWGFSSAAEIFFLISGYLVGAVYLRADRDARLDVFAARVFGRAGRLYLYNAGLFLLVLPICWLSPSLARLSFFTYFIDGGAISWAHFAAMYLQPYCLEILATYTVLLVAAPLFAWLLLRQPLVAIGLSLALYVAAYQFHELKLPGGTPAGDWRWNFSPASWQFLFFGALAAGRWRLLDRLRSLMVADARWLHLAAALFAGLTLLFLAQSEFGFQIMGQSKVRVGPIRIIHAVSASWLALGLFWRWPKLQQLALIRATAAVGSCSLQAFVASVVISYAAGLIWLEMARNYASYVLLCLAGMAALALFAQSYRLWQARPAIRLKPQPA